MRLQCRIFRYVIVIFSTISRGCWGCQHSIAFASAQILTAGAVRVCFRPTGLSGAVIINEGRYPAVFSSSNTMVENSGVPK